MDFAIIPFEIKSQSEDKDNYIVEGKASVYGNIDLVDDIVESGCFREDLMKEGNERSILWMHKWDEPIGKGTFQEYSDHLFTKILLPKSDTFVTGRVMPQLKINSITGLSIGYQPEEFAYDTVGDKQVRRLKRCKLREVSIVSFPANEQARISMIKSFQTHETKTENESKAVPPYKDYAIADDVNWDKLKAVKQIKEHTNSKDAPSSAYKNCFMFYDSDKADDFTGYKMPFVYFVDGNFKAVPKALSAIVGALSGVRGGVDVNDTDKAKIKSQINEYYKKMDREEPFKSNGNTFIDKKTLEGLEKRDYEKLFDDNILLSSQAKKKIADSLNFGNEVKEVRDDSFLKRLEDIESKI